MRTLSLTLVAALMATAASAQTTTNTPTTHSGTGMSARQNGAGAGNATAPGTGMVDHNTGTAAAGGNDNQAVATTGANATQPAYGANSFTRGEARHRIESEGFSRVASLHKDRRGVWRGMGTKDGQQTKVWLDYKGNVGTSSS